MAALMLLCSPLLAWTIRHDLRADMSDGGTRGDRWFFLIRPLLWAWTRSDDERRFNYAARAFVRHGGEPARQWLEATLTASPPHHFPFGSDDRAWVDKLGLRTDEPLRPAVRRAVASLSARGQFAGEFLRLLFEDPAMEERVCALLESEAPQPPPARAALLRELFVYHHCPYTERIEALYPSRPQSLRDDDRQDTRTLEEIADDRDSPLRAEAALALWEDGKGDRLRRMMSHDQRAFGVVAGLWMEKALRDRRLRNTPFARACRDFERIRGRKYYDYGSGDGDMRPLTAARDEAAWRRWLARYPLHPGADDASYWLGRSLEWQGKRAQALELYADMVVRPRGDGDLSEAVDAHFKLLLDVAATAADLRTFLERHPTHPLREFVRYAIAVRLAREHDYDHALELTASFTPSTFVPRENFPSLDRMALFEQRARWRSLKSIAAGPQREWRLAQAWSAENSWLNGYLLLWNNGRSWEMVRGTFGAVPESATPDCRKANPLMVAFELLKTVEADPRTQPDTRARALAMQIHLLSRVTSYADYGLLRQGSLLDHLQDGHRPWEADEADEIHRRLLADYPESPLTQIAARDVADFGFSAVPPAPTGTREDWPTWSELNSEAAEVLSALQF